MKTLFIILFISHAFLTFGQDSTAFVSDTSSKKQVSLKLNESFALQELESRFIRLNKQEQHVSGYRIQYYSGSREGAHEAKAQLFQLIPETEIYVLYQQPYFKTKLGNFRTKLEAEKFQRELGEVCKGCFIVREKIDFPLLAE